MVKRQMFLTTVISLKSRTAEENFGEILHIIVFSPPGKTTGATGGEGERVAGGAGVASACIL